MSKSNNAVKKVSLEQILPIIEEKLKAGGTVTFGPHGISMLPLIRQDRDSVTVSALKDTPKVGDVIFYRRPDGQFVLHRIVGRESDGFVLCGDNQQELERGVGEDWIIGIATSVCRGGKDLPFDSCGYKLYTRIGLPMWRYWLRTRTVLGKVKRSIKQKVGK